MQSTIRSEMHSIIELAIQDITIQVRISELIQREGLINSTIYKNRMEGLTEYHDLTIKMILDKVGSIYFKDSTFTIDNFNLVQKED